MAMEWSLPVLAWLPAGCTALGAAGVFLLRQRPACALQRVLLGFAAGVMMAASVFSLLLPAAQQAQGGVFPPWLVVSAGLCAGAFGLLWAERYPAAAACGSTGRVVFAITLHNLPEGMVVGLALALAARGDPHAVAAAAALSVGIGLQNIPEGAAISLPLRSAGAGRWRAFWCGAASGLVEPLGAALAFGLAGWVGPALPWLMAASAGVMLCVAAQEMIPQAAQTAGGTASVMLGFALMMALDLAL